MTWQCTGRHEIVGYDERYRDQVLGMRATFASIASEWNEAHFEWQQFENPWAEEPYIYLALCGDRVVGMRGLWTGQWEVGQPTTTFRAPHFAGTVIAPGHQRHGFFAALTEAAEADLHARGCPYALSFSAGPTTHIASLAAGWRPIGPLRPTERPPSIAGPAPHRRVLRVLRRSLPSLLRLSGSVTVGDKPIPEEMASLASACWDGRVRHVRDERYFRWRYRDPSSRYRFFFLRENNDLAGYIVLQQRARPRSAGLHLVDWETRGEGAWAELMTAALRFAESRQHALMTWGAALPSNAASIVREAGFVDAPPSGALGTSHPAALIRCTDPDAVEGSWVMCDRKLDDAESWDLRMVYSDAF